MATADGNGMATHKASLIAKHISGILQQHAPARLPLIVGVQGPQGSGKTTVTAQVKSILESQGKRTAVFSIDDLYLPHSGLESLKQEYPSNKLLHGRGQPGTHDLDLGIKLFEQLKSGNAGDVVRLPLFDKSAFQGEGDRKEETLDVTLPLDVVIFEGWCMGFYSVPEEELKQKFAKAQSSNDAETPYFTRHTLDSLLQINTILRKYEQQWYTNIDAFVLLRPDSLHNVFAWRLEAEQKMKAEGKAGMTDEQVHDFVARYMPGYELFGQGPLRKDTPWSGKGLLVAIDKQRNLVSVENF